MSEICVKTLEMHTGGEPIRIVLSGLPKILGETILDKRRYIRDNFDDIRKLIMLEPRGHCDMFGVYLVQPDMPGADLGCIFIHNEGYGTMCGHAVISLGRYAIDHGIVKNPTSPETRVVMQCPCGPVEAFVEYGNGKTGRVRFNSVPAFVFALDLAVEVPGYGHVTVDISYGGAFYALIPAASLGVDLKKSSVQDCKQAAYAVTEVLKKSLQLSHPDNPDLAYLFGTILTDGNDRYSETETANMCVFADREVDRSPCGSGVTARTAQHFARGWTKLGQSRTFRGPAGSKFTTKLVKKLKYATYDAVVVEVAGKGHYSGSCTFTAEADDEIGKGFLLQ